MRSTIRKVICTLIVLCLCATIFTFVIPHTEAASTGLSLAQLQRNFPHGSYWNHYVNNTSEASDYLRLTSKNEGFSDYVSNEPCALHGSASLDYFVYKQDCNFFDGAVQCAGFARKLGFEAYKTKVSTWDKSYSISTVKPGDVVHYYGLGSDSKNGHTVFVTAVSGTQITVGECNKGGNCLINWGRSFDLAGATSVTIYSAPYALSNNDTNSPVNIGTNFYAYIINQPQWRHVTNDGNNVSLRSETGKMNQVWYFERLSDGSYKITSVADGNCLDVYNFGTTNGTNVQTTTYSGNTAQQWYISGEAGNYTLRAKCASTVLDVEDNSTKEGANIQMYTPNGTGAQRFQIYQLDGYQKPYISASSSSVNLKTGSNTTITLNFRHHREWTVKTNRSNTNVSTSLGSYNGNSCPITITANSTGSTVLTFTLCDAPSQSVIATCTVNATVSSGTYTVSYNANGGSGAPKSQIKTHGVNMTLSTTIPTRVGYTLLGWSENPTATTATYQPGSSFSTNADTILYAVWKPNTYNIVYHANGATSGATANQECQYNTKYNLTANGYKREYTVTYDATGGSVNIDKATASATFNGWEDRGSIVCNGTTYSYNSDTKFDAPYYANTYLDIRNTFGYNKYKLISHYYNYVIIGTENRTGWGSTSGLYPDNAEVCNLSTEDDYNVPLYANWTLGKVTLPVPSRAGYTFCGWYTSQSGGAKVGNGGDDYTPNSNVTLYAAWEPIGYTISYNANGATSGVTANQECQYNTKYNLTANGYKREYTVTYDATGGSVNVDKATASATFNGWEDRGSIIYNGITYSYDSATRFDAPFYAQHHEDVFEHVNFGNGHYNKLGLLRHYVMHGINEGRDTYGSSPGLYPDCAEVSNLSTTDGCDVYLYANWTLDTVILPTPSRNGYTFSGWYTAPAGGAKIGNGGENYTPSDNITLYAIWEKNPSVCIFEGATKIDEYTSIVDALQAYTAGQHLKLLEDVNATLSLSADLYIDLNSYDLSGTITTNGYKIYGMDSATDGYSCEAIGYFNCVDDDGNAIVPVSHFKSDITGETKRYMALKDGNGYSFHRFYMGITHQSLKPTTTGVGYKAVFYGDDMVAANLDSFGFTMALGNFAPMTVSKEASGFVSGKVFSLRIDNYDVEKYGETNLYAAVMLKLADGTVIESAPCVMTLRGLLETLNENYTSLTDDQLTAVANFIEQHDIILSWNIENLAFKPPEAYPYF